MMAPDLINGCFEVLGGVGTLHSCCRLYQDKVVRGISVPTTILFASWGFWNLWFYPNLNQWISFYGGLLIVTGNCIWIALALRYRHR